MSARLLAVLVAVATVFFGVSALAAAPHMNVAVDPPRIEVDGTTSVTLQAMSDGDMPTDAKIGKLPPGLTVIGTNSMPTQQLTVINGQISQKRGLSTTWTLHATSTGRLEFGGVSVAVDGVRYATHKLHVTVVAKGTLGNGRQSGAPDPFDPFSQFRDLLQGSGMPNFPGFQIDQQPQMPEVPTDPKLALSKARDTVAFLHATLDKDTAVVGEQVTLSVYLYVDLSANQPDFTDPHEPSTSDFLRRSLMKDDNKVEQMGFGEAGGRVWSVALVRRYALFPLKTGDLTITPMRLSMVQGGGKRLSETLHVHAVAPPMAGRPAGYVVGDVGQYTLTASVAPRTVPRGGAVAVSVVLSGTGNLPSSLTVPTRPGVEWLDPDVKDDITSNDGKLGGKRTFDYVVHATQQGQVDLGEMTLPYYDPDAKSYEVARAALGSITVTPGVGAAPESSARVLDNLPPMRTTLGGTRVEKDHLADRGLFWVLLGMPILAFAGAVSGKSISERLRERMRRRRESPETELRERIRTLEEDLSGTDARAIDGSTMRVVEAGAIARAGVNVRGVGGESMVDVLTQAGVAKDVAADLRDVLESCAAARFSPDGGQLDGARDRARRGKALLDKLPGSRA